nr:hypothetical protein Iba_chr04fCG5490 [Ipomoea batatas]
MGNKEIYYPKLVLRSSLDSSLSSVSAPSRLLLRLFHHCCRNARLLLIAIQLSDLFLPQLSGALFQRPAFSDLTFPSLCYDFSFLTALKFGRSSVHHSPGFIKEPQSAIQFLDYLAGLPWSFGAWQSRRLLVYSHARNLCPFPGAEADYSKLFILFWSLNNAMRKYHLSQGVQFWVLFEPFQRIYSKPGFVGEEYALVP